MTGQLAGLARSPDAAALAARLVENQGYPLPAIGDAQALELAWALKDLCYGAWSTEPARAALAADALRTVSQEHPRGDAGREIEALARWTDGIAHLTRGAMSEALVALDGASELLMHAGRPSDAAQTQVPKIMALTMLGRHEDAIATAERARTDFLRTGDDHAAAKVSLNLGSLHLRRDRYDEAALNYRKAAVLFARAGDHERSIMADIGIADAMTAQGAFPEALRTYARVAMRAAARGFPVLEAMQQESVALLELARGRYAEALSGLERCRRTYESLGMPQHLAIAEKQLGDAYLELRLVPEALALFDEAVARFASQGLQDDLAWTLVQIGRGHGVVRAIEPAAQAFARAAAAFGEQQNGVGLASVALGRAELALQSGDAARALAFAREAREEFAAAGLAERALRAQVLEASAALELGEAREAAHLFAATLARARELQLTALQVTCLTGQGRVARALGDSAGARMAFAAAVELFTEQRAALPGDDLRDAFLASHLHAHRELVRLALEDHARVERPDTAADVLDHLEAFRARTLGERIARPGSTSDATVSSEVRARVNWLQRRLVRLTEEGGDIAGISTQLRAAERELLEAVRRERLVAGMAGDDDDVALDLRRLRAMLGDDGALLEYGVVDDELFACVVTRDNLVVRRGVASWPLVEEAIRSARFQIETLRHGGAPLEQHRERLTERARARMQRLHGLVVAPLAHELAGVQRLLIVPYGALASVPFAALHDGRRYLAESFEIAVVPSARLASSSLGRATHAPTRPLVMGASARLPHAAREASFVASLLPDGVALLHADANVDAFTRGAPDADLIHLACHAQFRADNPAFSALHLTDGAVTAELVERLRLAPATVVLSACETAATEQGAGDEMFGLLRAFLIAGAARVVASLWPVDDAVTAALMSVFYRELCAGAGPAAALRRAQCELMASHPHPFHWAAFTAYGGW